MTEDKLRENLKMALALLDEAALHHIMPIPGRDAYNTKVDQWHWRHEMLVAACKE